jgi:hypothetical protein
VAFPATTRPDNFTHGIEQPNREDDRLLHVPVLVQAYARHGSQTAGRLRPPVHRYRQQIAAVREYLATATRDDVHPGIAAALARRWVEPNPMLAAEAFLEVNAIHRSSPVCRDYLCVLFRLARARSTNSIRAP